MAKIRLTHPKDFNFLDQGDIAVGRKFTMLASKIADKMLLAERDELRAANSELNNDVLALLEDYAELKNKLELQ
jgi:chromosome segregation ATPase